MIIVAAVERVEIDGAFTRQIFLVGNGSQFVAVDHVLIVAAENVDVGWHVNEVACIGDEAA